MKRIIREYLAKKRIIESMRAGGASEALLGTIQYLPYKSVLREYDHFIREHSC